MLGVAHGGGCVQDSARMTTEGATRIDTTFADNAGPQSKSAEGAFFNPAMRTNRDLSVRTIAAYAAMRGRSIDVADVLAGTGARSLRIAKEAAGDIHVFANDADPRAAKAMTAGVDTNGVADRVTVRHGGAYEFLASRRFDVVDVDPFGSPMPFLDAAMRATRHDGLVCITATDTAALSGTYPRVCQRRYGAKHQLRAAPWRAEVGLRILAGAIIRAAGRFDRSATPLWSVSGGHWMRVVARIEDGRRSADGSWRGLGTIGLDDDGRPTDGDHGPLWMGSLHDASFVVAMSSIESPASDKTHKLLATMAAEADAPAYWIDPGVLRRRFNIDAPKRAAFVERLRDAGFEAAPTHMDPQGIRTDAPTEALQPLWRG